MVRLAGWHPFVEETTGNILEDKILEAAVDWSDEHLANVSSEAKDFVSRLLQKYPSSRPTAESCLLHPWIRQTSPMTRSLDTNKRRMREYKKYYEEHAEYQINLKGELALAEISATLTNHRLPNLRSNSELGNYSASGSTMSPINVAPQPCVNHEAGFSPTALSSRHRARYSPRCERSAISEDRDLHQRITQLSLMPPQRPMSPSGLSSLASSMLRLDELSAVDTGPSGLLPSRGSRDSLSYFGGSLAGGHTHNSSLDRSSLRRLHRGRSGGPMGSVVATASGGSPGPYTSSVIASAEISELDVGLRWGSALATERESEQAMAELMPVDERLLDPEERSSSQTAASLPRRSKATAPAFLNCLTDAYFSPLVGVARFACQLSGQAGIPLCLPPGHESALQTVFTGIVASGQDALNFPEGFANTAIGGGAAAAAWYLGGCLLSDGPGVALGAGPGGWLWLYLTDLGPERVGSVIECVVRNRAGKARTQARLLLAGTLSQRWEDCVIHVAYFLFLTLLSAR
ncbi:unnamed protein product [Protopolystoma xenopodis]|uniref:Protein kinase domain-containing protein n=1 Tax=Protopolystoma xenopodis TaxID=117903 RepID=A0A3S5AM72_9PLAT|nr:unnamed protein product [Protopolystoma xenopodis]